MWAVCRVISVVAAHHVGPERELLGRRCSGSGVEARWFLIEQLRQAGKDLLICSEALLKDGVLNEVEQVEHAIRCRLLLIGDRASFAETDEGALLLPENEEVDSALERNLDC